MERAALRLFTLPVTTASGVYLYDHFRIKYYSYVAHDESGKQLKGIFHSRFVNSAVIDELHYTLNKKNVGACSPTYKITQIQKID